MLQDYEIHLQAELHLANILVCQKVHWEFIITNKTLFSVLNRGRMVLQRQLGAYVHVNQWEIHQQCPREKGAHRTIMSSILIYLECHIEDQNLVIKVHTGFISIIESSKVHVP